MKQKDALEIMQMGYNVFLTGEAGTGKTHTLNRYISFLRKKHIPLAVTASTGIAATHLDGVTVDSWSGLGIHDEISVEELHQLARKFHLKQRLQKVKVLIIDEVSMIHGRRFDATNKIVKFLRKSDLPFGGIQVILSGDLFQLPPVSKDRQNNDYIYKSHAWKELDLKICYLSEVRRQKDAKFLQILSDIRHNHVNQNTLSLLKKTAQTNSNDNSTKLYTHNIDVDAINRTELEKMSSETHQYAMTSMGPEKITEAMKKNCLAPQNLQLKKGALVMFVRNNFEKGYFNGTLGKIIGFTRDDSPMVKTISDNKIVAEKANWTISENEKIIAQISQIPLRLAWAITVHKSQGMTLDAAEIDLSKSFVAGMGYVALSRVRSLKHLRLIGFNQMALKVSPEISAIDETLIELSDKNSKRVAEMSFLKKWLKKREFMYKLTSQD